MTIRFQSVEEAISEIFRTVLQMPSDDVDESEAIFTAADRLPKDHVVHRIASLAFRCSSCGHAGFVRDTVLNLETHEAGCPKCDADGALKLLEGGVA